MQKFQFRPVRMGGRTVRAVLGCALLILCATGAAQAQAGRRVQKPKEDPPVPKPVETPTPVAPKPTEAQLISLFVGTSRAPAIYGMGNAGALLRESVGRRLSDSKSLKLGFDDNMSRGEANKRAKADETGTFVVWFELRDSNSFLASDPRTSRRDRLEDLQIQYVVLEPKTGRVRDQGTVYLRRSASIGGVGVGRGLPRCYPQAYNSTEYALIEAGIETAERIMRGFSLASPPPCS